MTSFSECPHCQSFFVIEQWISQKKIISTMNVSGIKKRPDNFDNYRKFESQKDPVNIFHSLFKIIESKNV
jgi:hypothetical protein